MEGHFSPITSWIDLQTKDNLTPTQVVEFYNDWAETYDESVRESQSNTIALKAALEQLIGCVCRMHERTDPVDL